MDDEDGEDDDDHRLCQKVPVRTIQILSGASDHFVISFQQDRYSREGAGGWRG